MMLLTRMSTPPIRRFVHGCVGSYIIRDSPRACGKRVKHVWGWHPNRGNSQSGHDDVKDVQNLDNTS